MKIADDALMAAVAVRTVICLSEAHPYPRVLSPNAIDGAVCDLCRAMGRADLIQPRPSERDRLLARVRRDPETAMLALMKLNEGRRVA